MDPTITVVIPVYNTQEYLEECLTSIKNQTFSNIQVLIVNDCTPDNSMAIAEKFVESDNRFQIIHHEKNKGAGGARNTGISNAKGKYISFLDSDDTYPLDSLSHLYDSIIKNDADLVLGRMFQRTSQGELIPVDYIEKRIQSYLKNPNTNLRSIPVSEFFCGNVTNQLYRIDLFRKNNIRFLEGVYHEDMPATLQTWYYSKAINVVPYITHYRTIRENENNPSVTQTFNYKAFKDRDVILQYIYDFCLENAKKNNDLVNLTIEIMHRINSTTQNMITSVKDTDRTEILDMWYPEHKKRCENMIKDIGDLKREFDTCIFLGAQ